MSTLFARIFKLAMPAFVFVQKYLPTVHPTRVTRENGVTHVFLRIETRIQLVFLNIEVSSPLVTSYSHFSVREYSGGDLQDFVERR